MPTKEQGAFSNPLTPFLKGGKGGLKVFAIIPARYNSTRLPGKPLLNILGKPMIQHVWERSMKAGKIERVIVATDDERVYDAVKAFGGEAAMTSKNHLSGTDRIAEVAASLPFNVDIIVNVQGDEPLIEPEMIDQVINLLVNDPGASIGTLCREVEDKDEIVDHNVVKVVFDKDGSALYFSRLPIPYYRDEGPRKIYYKHLGIYSYRRDALLKLNSLNPTPLEKAEKLEQLRALENGLKIKVGVTDRDTIGVDTIEDLEKVIKIIKDG